MSHLDELAKLSALNGVDRMDEVDRVDKSGQECRGSEMEGFTENQKEELGRQVGGADIARLSD